MSNKAKLYINKCFNEYTKNRMLCIQFVQHAVLAYTGNLTVYFSVSAKNAPVASTAAYAKATMQANTEMIRKTLERAEDSERARIALYAREMRERGREA